MAELAHKPTQRQLVVNGVLEQIQSGSLRTGDKLLPTDQLAAYYGVSVPTAHKAVRELVDQGYVTRKTGAGTFVTERERLPTNRTVGLLIVSDGHLWEDVARNLLMGLRELAVSPFLVSLDGLSADQVGGLPAFQQLVSLKPDVVVTSGVGMTDLIRGALPECRIISLLSGRQSPTYQIVPNFTAVGHLCGRHLAEAGYSQVDYMDVNVVPDIDHWQTHESALVNRGLAESLREHGATYGRLVSLRGPIDGERSGQIIREYLMSDERAAAVVCQFGHRTLEVWRHARELGLRIPQDLALMSALDTPMTRSFDISGVDQRFGEMATACVGLIEQVMAGERAGNHSTVHLIEPTLNVRGSTRHMGVSQ